MADGGRSSRPHPVVQLMLMRLRELRREPGTLFWVFGFPILISMALGLAFRSTGPEPVIVGALPGVSDDVTRALVAGGGEGKPLAEAGGGHGRPGWCGGRRGGEAARRWAIATMPCGPRRGWGGWSSTISCSAPPAAAIRVRF